MNSWLYLTAKDFAHHGEIDFCNARVYLWHDHTAPHCSALSEAAPALKGREVKLILPMEMCSWLLTEPWPGRGRPTAQSLAFSVEDQLADDLDDLHIAVGPVQTPPRYPLLVTHKQRLKDVLKQLRECGLNIVSAHADADLLPRDQAYGAWWDGRWLIGGALDARLALSAQNLEAVKTLLPQAMVWLPEQARAPFSPHGINLLQGEFRQASTRLPWRGLSAALLLVFSLALGFTHLRSAFLEGEAARLYALSEQRFKALYPEQARIVDLSAQLKAVQQQGATPGTGHLVRLLQLTEQVIGASSVEVQRMEWRAGVGWALNITASSFAEVEQLRARGVQSALPITLGNASQQGNRVQALLTLEDVR